MADETLKNKKVNISYTSREFNSVRKDLLQHARKYYPTSYLDFSEASFGSFVVDAVSYATDILSFYTDYQINESFLNSANEFQNVIKLGRYFGYEYEKSSTAAGILGIYALIPANSTGLGPDTRYIPLMKAGSMFEGQNGASYILTQDVDFSLSTNQVVAHTLNPTTGVPTKYAIRAYGKIVSGILRSDILSIGSFKKFRRVRLTSSDIVEILKVTDSEGNEYYKVDNLSQDVIYKQISNPTVGQDQVKSLLKPFLAARRFVVEKETNFTYLRFGSGQDDLSDSEMIVDPSDVMIKMNGKNYFSNTLLDPNKILNSDTLGIAPSDTTLFVEYRALDNTRSNAAAGQINKVKNVVLAFEDEASVTATIKNDMKNSVEVFNDSPIVGSVQGVDIDEMKARIAAKFSSQGRAVTKKDYESVIYNMPASLGKVTRCMITRDEDSLKRNLNAYVISQAPNDTLQTANNVLKQNLKTWIGEYKMISDTIDILDAKIVNFGVEFIVSSKVDADKTKLLKSCIDAITREFAIHNQIGEAISIAKMYNVLNKIPDVDDVKDVVVDSKATAMYSSATFNFDSRKTSDGKFIVPPKNVIMELKFPNFDIKGSVV
jgi:hypothetical protein